MPLAAKHAKNMADIRRINPPELGLVLALLE
jgi:hypothetical protein